jgi:YD repeat-containing protein
VAAQRWLSGDHYTYDGLLRLVEAVETPGNSYAYSYDDTGNHRSSCANLARRGDDLAPRRTSARVAVTRGRWEPCNR